MMSYLDKKWMIMQPVAGGRWGKPNKDTPWTQDSSLSVARLLQASGDHVCNSDIDMTADIYYIINFVASSYEKELEFIKEVKQRGAKTIICFSADLRFLTGGGLYNDKNINYTDLCKEVDLIFSATPPNIKIYGRYQNKVCGTGVFIEPLNLGLEYNERDIDILFSGMTHEHNFSFVLELMLMFKDKYPEKRIVYPTNYKQILQPLYPEIDFISHEEYSAGLGLVSLLKKTKVYVNVDVRVTPNRTVLESFYCKTPYISCTSSVTSKYYPDFTYDSMNMEHILNQYDKLINSDREGIIKKSEVLAEPDYFENAIVRIMDRLYPE